MGEEEKKEILGQKLDEGELDEVAGGEGKLEDAECPNKGIVGACTAALYVEPCRATVEQNSDCWRTDWHTNGYTVTRETYFKYKLICKSYVYRV